MPMRHLWHHPSYWGICHWQRFRTREEDIAGLKEQAKALEEELSRLRKYIEELEKHSEKGAK
ncbi:MAG: DUF5320 domain-containing protein [bacterium]